MTTPLEVPRAAALGAYLLVLVFVAVTSLIVHLLRDVLSTPIVALLYLLPVVASAARFGLGAGALSALAAFLSFNYLFFTPTFTFIVHQPSDVLILVVFLGVAVIISDLVGRTRASLAEARERQREAVHLYELSTTLAGLRSAEAIAGAVADRLQELVQAAAVDIALAGEPAGSPAASEVRAPAEAQPAGPHADVVVPLLTAAGLLGELRIWRGTQPLGPSEERLARTFANQTALALERAQLAEAERRAALLEESDRLKSALLSSVSHELRTPLATIKAAATSLQHGTVAWETAAREDLLAAIAEETDQLNYLVANLLSMSRLEAGALQPERQWNDLVEIVDGTLGRLERVVADHSVEVDVPDDLPLVPVDAILLEQVLRNLIGNSAKFAPAGTRIGIRARAGADALTVEIHNAGPPVPPGELDTIFERFHRADGGQHAIGTGLGLSICKGIVAAHGGRIWAENRPDGFAVIFSLPLAWEGGPRAYLPPEAETPEVERP